jgi:ParB family chromosome partitioning protein
MNMQKQLPLKSLQFGHDASVIVNARVSGRQDGIDTLAANIHARGLIEPLIVVKDGDRDTYFVSDGNRRLAALQNIFGPESSQLIECNVRDVDGAGAFEDSLTAAVLAHQLHPVDQYEAFAKLESNGKSHEEIARHFGLTEKQVRQALALGGLSPKIREAWRKDEIRAETAQAFTLARDQKSQEKVFAKLAKAEELNAHQVRAELGVKSNAHLAEMIKFVTPDLYRSRGGKITEDLFGEFHSISDEALVKTLAAEEIDRHCAELIAAGWSWAKPLSDLPAGARHWMQKPVADKDLVWLEGEKEQRAALDKKLTAMENDSDAWDHEEQQILEGQIDAIDRAVRGRSFSDKQKAQLGCIVDIEDGELEISYGIVKPAEQLPVKRGEKADDTDDAPGAGAAAAPLAKEPTTISNAMRERLETQLLHATKDALLADTVGGHPNMVILAGIVADQIRPEQKFHMPPAVTNKLPALRAALDPAAVNAAIAKRFDSKDYFGGAPKIIVLKAVKESINADEARKLTSSSKADIGKFALTNVVKTGWLPKELRTPHYAGPGSDGYKKPAAASATAKEAAPARAAAKTAAKPKPPAKPAALKRAASAKKSVKKTSAKKTPAKKKKA